MVLPRSIGVGLLTFVLVCASTAEAQFPRLRRALRPYGYAGFGMYDPYCGLQHMDPCGCGDPCGQPLCAPTCGTVMQPQQVVTYQTVPTIQYQRQAVVQQVPVTTYQNVTVDEGSYQTVWVPRPVTRQVATTVMQSQTRYQDVAVQVNQQVAQVQTQMVPRQALRYTPTAALVGASPTACCQPGGIAGWPGMAIAPGMTQPIATLPGEPIPATQADSRLVPHPKYLEMPADTEEWSTIQQRGAVPAVPQGASLQAPTAATIWQSRRDTDAVIR
jgi:hypothetical protein